MIHVRYEMRWKAIGVMKTMLRNISTVCENESEKWDPYTKFNSQFALVLSPLAGPRILNGTISTWYNHAMPCHPMAKKTEKPKRKTVLAILAASLPTSSHKYCRIVKSTMHPDMPAAPNNINERLPQNRSIPTTVTNEARKYEVAEQLARSRASHPVYDIRVRRIQERYWSTRLIPVPCWKTCTKYASTTRWNPRRSLFENILVVEP